MMQTRKVNVLHSSNVNAQPHGVVKKAASKATVVVTEKRRLSARLAAKQVLKDKENLPQCTGKTHVSVAQSKSSVSAKTTASAAAKSRTTPASKTRSQPSASPSSSFPIVPHSVKSYQTTRDAMRVQLLSLNPALLTLVATENGSGVSNGGYKVHYSVGDHLERQMSPELLMEEMALPIFDHLRELEINLLEANLDAAAISAVMTPPFPAKPTGASFLGNTFRSKMVANAPVEAEKRITVRMRYMLVNWLAEVHEHMDLLPETLFLTVALLDLYLAKEAARVSRDVLQLLGLACLQVAAKFEEMCPPQAAELASIADNSYTVAQINEYEGRVLRLVRFNVTFPVPITFFRRFSRLLVATDKEHAMAKYFSELTVMDLTLACTSPSLRAAASLILARVLLHLAQGAEARDADSLRLLVRQSWSDVLQFHSGYHADQLLPVIGLLASLLERHNLPSQLRAIRNKYSRPEFGGIGADPLLKCGLLEKVSTLLNTQA